MGDSFETGTADVPTAEDPPPGRQIAWCSCGWTSPPVDPGEADRLAGVHEADQHPSLWDDPTLPDPAAARAALSRARAAGRTASTLNDGDTP